MLDPLFFLISRLNNACSPVIINLQIKLIGIKDIHTTFLRLLFIPICLCYFIPTSNTILLLLILPFDPSLGFGEKMKKKGKRGKRRRKGGRGKGKGEEGREKGQEGREKGQEGWEKGQVGREMGARRKKKGARGKGKGARGKGKRGKRKGRWGDRKRGKNVTKNDDVSKVSFLFICIFTTKKKFNKKQYQKCLKKSQG